MKFGKWLEKNKARYGVGDKEEEWSPEVVSIQALADWAEKEVEAIDKITKKFSSFCEKEPFERGKIIGQRLILREMAKGAKP